RVVYVSPLRALSNDMHRNLEVPLAEIQSRIADSADYSPIRVELRTGDSTPSERARLVRKPPHILVTTPESLYLLLTAAKGRDALQNVETVIVDEIHALVRDKRGSHLSLTLERLEALTRRALQRIGLSATQKPIEQTAAFLVGDRGNDTQIVVADGRGSRTDERGSETADSSRSAIRDPRASVTIVDIGHARELDLAIEVPPSELGAVCMHEQWAEVNQRLVELINAHRSTLIFVNQRRLAERVTHELTELLGEHVVGAHHGSLAAGIRLDTERRLKSGDLKAVVATASLELGLDIGYIDLVIQIGSPRAIATLLQRIGRSGHSLGKVPKGRLFALTRDELLECMALIRAVCGGRLDVVQIPEAPLDVLAQQIVAEAAARDCDADELFALVRRAYPYRNLSRPDFDRTIEYLSEGLSRTAGRGRRYLHVDQVHGRLKARKGARIAATSNAGAIPEIASYRVVVEPEQTVVGSLDEDFSVESNRGDVFLLGNTSWRILYVRGGDVTVVDAQGAPPTIPFWRGEAPGRTFELSQEVSALRAELEQRLGAASSAPDAEHPPTDLELWLAQETHCTPSAARQALDYAAAQKAGIGLLPTQRRVVFERFFDETGGMQLVVHAPFGAAINRAWAFAMRKRFCRSFDFELQSTADDDGFILSLGPQHSFPIQSLFAMLSRRNARGLLEQALLAAPVFQIRWRWNVTRALLVLRRHNGQKVPPHLQRFRADDLLTAVFPRLTGCQEEHTGDIEVPDHPLVRQTMDDCLHEFVDIDGLEHVLDEIERGEIELIARDTREPSPFCYELLNAYPYAFLDGGEIQERRTRAVSARRSLTVESVADLGRLDPQAIAQVIAEAQPSIRDADELHDVLLSRISIPVDEFSRSQALPGSEVDEIVPKLFAELAAIRRAAQLTLPDGRSAWVAAERLPAAQAAFPDGCLDPPLDAPPAVRRDWPSTEARVAMVGGLLEICGPITSTEVARRLSITPDQAFAALEALEGEGAVLRGHFTPAPDSDAPDATRSVAEPRSHAEPGNENALNPQLSSLNSPEWCHRRLLARIHRLTLAGLRRQIEPVGVDVYLRFLTRHHGLLKEHRRSGPNGLFEVVGMLQGIDVPAVCWERDLLPGRLEGYTPAWLDELCLTGEIGWGRLFPPKPNPDRARPMASLTRVAPVSLFLRSDAEWLTWNEPDVTLDVLTSPARQVIELLASRGAMFAADLLAETRMLPAHLDDALGELVARGLVTADGFSGLRRLIREKKSNGAAPRLRTQRHGLARTRAATAGTGRWSLRRRLADSPALDTRPSTLDPPQQWAWQLLRRWGVVFRDLLAREPGAPSWFELCRVYRRLEARGEIRGGRFITGVAGEQFALGETVRELRRLRDSGPADELVVLAAADPLNLIGVITPDPRVPAKASNRVALVDGVLAASLIGGEFVPQERFDALHPQQLVKEAFGAMRRQRLSVGKDGVEHVVN
ncbi:MAG TPA: DEAD/DEAH box helicase, partial [Planctomycetaceae bacterium]|nr:DEAD/DEAH box helicase [Planctomycetaceae bacterium]